MLKTGPINFFHHLVAVTDAAGFHFDSDPIRFRLWSLSLDLSVLFRPRLRADRFHTVSPDNGSREDIRNLGQVYRLMFDGVLNHASSQSMAFQEMVCGNPQ
jgi:hypothetical protein